MSRAPALLAILGAVASAGAFVWLEGDPRAAQERSPTQAVASSSSSLPLESVQRIDFHTHLHPATLDSALKLLDEGDIDLAVNLAAVPSGETLGVFLAMNERSGGRVLTFAGLDWRLLAEPSFGEKMADDLERAVKQGARGLKIPKALGLMVPSPGGGLLAIDDARLDPVFERAGELSVPVAIHVADPVAFWLPIDDDNERLEELSHNPGWSYYGKPVPSHAELLAQARRRYARHPKTTFVAVHVAGNPEDLNYVAALLRELPNVYVDIAARVPELGRHPAADVRAFFVEFQDRILFGTDLGVSPQGVMLGAPLAWRERWQDVVRFFSSTKRFLETADVQFEHPTPIQGAWKIDGIDLPDDVLRKVYRDNAVKLLRLAR